LGACLFQDVVPMNVDRPRRNAEPSGDFLGRLSVGDKPQHVTLANREAVDAAFDAATMAVPFDAPRDPVQQLSVADRLLQQVQGSFLHRLDDHRHVFRPCDNEEGLAAALCQKPFAQI
jgi:hypothetical protein